MNTHNLENESSALNKVSMPPCPFSSDTGNSKFYIPFIPMYLFYQKTSILQLKGG